MSAPCRVPIIERWPFCSTISIPCPTCQLRAPPRLVDDAAIFPPGDAPLAEAVGGARRPSAATGAELVGRFVLSDTDLPRSRLAELAVGRVVTGGAGRGRRPSPAWPRQASDCASPGSRSRCATSTTWPATPAGCVAAVDAAPRRRLGRRTSPSYVELPHGRHDRALARGRRRGRRGRAATEVPHRRARSRRRSRPRTRWPRWIDAALDRETPFKCTAGLHHAVRHTGDDGFEHHGFLNVLLATRRALRRRRAPTRSSSRAGQRDGAAVATSG